MNLKFDITFLKRKYTFTSVSDMEEFIFKNKKLLRNSVIILKDENDKITGMLKVTDYLKLDENFFKC